MEPGQKEYWFAQERANAAKYQQEMQESDRPIQPRNASTPRAVSQDMIPEERQPPYAGYGSYGPPQSAERPPRVKREEEDVEMQDDEAPPPDAEGCGFTAINRSQ